MYGNRAPLHGASSVNFAVIVAVCKGGHPCAGGGDTHLRRCAGFVSIYGAPAHLCVYMRRLVTTQARATEAINAPPPGYTYTHTHTHPGACVCVYRQSYVRLMDPKRLNVLTLALVFILQNGVYTYIRKHV